MRGSTHPFIYPFLYLLPSMNKPTDLFTLSFNRLFFPWFYYYPLSIPPMTTTPLSYYPYYSITPFALSLPSYCLPSILLSVVYVDTVNMQGVSPVVCLGSAVLRYLSL